MSAQSNSSYTYPVLSACAWRVVSELLGQDNRRHHLRVSQAYPGLSVHGELDVHPRPVDPFDPVRRGIRISLGGGGNGRCSLLGEGAVDRPLQPVTALLEGGDAASLAHNLAGEAGWEAGAPSKDSDAGAIGAQLIAGFLGRHMLGPSRFRASSGFISTSNERLVAGWVARVASKKLERCDPSPEDANRAARYWAVHQTESTGGYLDEWSPDKGPALVFDFATGLVTPLHAPEKSRDILTAGQQSRAPDLPLMLWLEELMHSPQSKLPGTPYQSLGSPR